MTSLWLSRPDLPQHAPASGEHEVDIAVVGAGLTGLVSALLFARAGSSVAVLEGRHVGAGATGNTTAKLSLLQGTKLSTIARKNPSATVQAYVDANDEGMAWLLRYCEAHNIPFQRQPAFTYATSDDGVTKVQTEMRHCLEAGLGVAWEDELDLPYPTRGGIRLDNQAQFDPLDVLTALARDVHEHGGHIYDHSRVRQVQTRGDRVTLHTDESRFTARHVVLATGTPILDRGGYFARLEPKRSYAAAFTTSTPPGSGMYLSADSPTRSVRWAPRDGEDLLLIGGNGHVVGRQSPTSDQVADLVSWTQRHFPGATLTHSWSAQDYSSIDGVPYVGPLVPGRDDVLVATGYDKWGMTNAVAAALALSGRVLGGTMPWAASLDSWRVRELAGVPKAAQLSGSVAAHLVRDWAAVSLSGASAGAAPPEGEGVVERSGGLPSAVCTVDGVTTRLSAVCTHLGGIVSWNDAERSWDCPLHGSRFNSDGDVLEGPATRSLASRDAGSAG